MTMSYGYGCFWGTAFGPWAMFHEKEDAIEYAEAQVKRKRADGRDSIMRVLFFHDGKWDEDWCWSSVHEWRHEAAAEEG